MTPVTRFATTVCIGIFVGGSSSSGGDRGPYCRSRRARGLRVCDPPLLRTFAQAPFDAGARGAKSSLAAARRPRLVGFRRVGRGGTASPSARAPLRGADGGGRVPARRKPVTAPQPPARGAAVAFFNGQLLPEPRCPRTMARHEQRPADAHHHHHRREAPIGRQREGSWASSTYSTSPSSGRSSTDSSSLNVSSVLFCAVVGPRRPG